MLPQGKVVSALQNPASHHSVPRNLCTALTPSCSVAKEEELNRRGFSDSLGLEGPLLAFSRPLAQGPCLWEASLNALSPCPDLAATDGCPCLGICVYAVEQECRETAPLITGAMSALHRNRGTSFSRPYSPFPHRFYGGVSSQWQQKTVICKDSDLSFSPDFLLVLVNPHNLRVEIP